MAWYKTGTLSVPANSVVVTGTGTQWANAIYGIGPGQMLLVPGSGTVRVFEILAVDSNTQLRLVTSPGAALSASAYAIVSFYTDSVPDFARRLSAQLSYYQSQMDGWQQIMTGTGTVNITAPDGTVVALSSFVKLTNDVAAKMVGSNNLSELTDAAAARTKLGLGYTLSVASGTGDNRIYYYQDSKLMIITRRISFTATANASTAWTWNWNSELGLTFASPPTISFTGQGGNSGSMVYGMESTSATAATGFIRNNNTSNVSGYLHVTIIGAKA